MSLTSVPSYSFPTVDFALAHISEPLASIALRQGFEVQSWSEDGLGLVRGAFLRLASGRVVLLRESVHEEAVHGAVGPIVLVDATDLATIGPESLVIELAQEIGLSAAQITWQQEPTIRAHAALVAEWSQNFRAAQARGLPLPEYPR